MQTTEDNNNQESLKEKYNLIPGTALYNQIIQKQLLHAAEENIPKKLQEELKQNLEFTNDLFKKIGAFATNTQTFTDVDDFKEKISINCHTIDGIDMKFFNPKDLMDLTNHMININNQVDKK